MARLLDVAKQAGVSTATASRVFNAYPGVSPAKRQAVLSAADALGYAPVTRRTQTQTVGVIVPELENPVFAGFAQQLATSLRRAGCHPLLGTETAAGIVEDEWIEMLLELGAKGIVIVSGMHADTHASPQRYEMLRGRGLALVLVNGYVPDIDAAFVSADDRAAVSRAVAHLFALGHRRIGLAAGPERYVPVIRKSDGFRRAVAAAGDGARGFVETTMFTIEGGAAAATRLLDRGVTAMICASDVMALGAYGAIRAAGLDVPADVSVVGFDDSAVSAFAGPPLTTLRQPVPEMCRAATRLLVDELNGITPPRQEFLFQPELIVRGSTGAARLPAQSGTGAARGERRSRAPRGA